MARFKNLNSGIRDLRDGGWYWISRAILHTYGRRLKPSGIAVYNALASFANFETQTCFPTQEAIARLVGISRRTVGRKVKLLEQLGLIRVERKRGSCIYHLLEPGDAPKRTQPCDRNDPSDRTPRNTNKNHLTRINNKNIDDKNFLNPDGNTCKGFKPRSREELLALDLAQALNDLRGLPLYLSYARKYPESLLRKVLGEVKEIPDEKIKRRRAALFNYLVQKYAKKASKNIRD
jgi:biotin operon repressor